MSAPPPPPPPPPAPAPIKSGIPKSNKNLLQSIEKGTKLKRVPESAKNDRSSGLAAAGITPTGSVAASKPVPQNQGSNINAKMSVPNGPIDLQSQLKSQLMSRKTGNNSAPERKTSVPVNNYVSVRPPVNQPINKPPPIVPSVSNRITSSVTNNTRAFSAINGPSQPLQTQSSSGNNREPHQVAISNKPIIAKVPPAQMANPIKPAPLRPSANVINESSSNPLTHQFRGANNRPHPSNPAPLESNNGSNQPMPVKIRAQTSNYLPSNNNQMTPSNQPPLDNYKGPNQVISSNSRAPAPNQAASVRPPPPPPANSKPLQRNSISMDNIVHNSVVPNFSEPLKQMKPLSQTSSNSSYSRQSSSSSVISQAAANPPPPAPLQPRPQGPSEQRFAPPVPMRILPQQPSTTAPYKVADRAPPPAPPGASRISRIADLTAFDRRFTFPDESQFPGL